MFHYFNSVQNKTGDALSGYFVKAVDPNTGNVVDIYADANATPIITVSGIADAAQVDSNGNVSFYINGGQYHLDHYAADATTFLMRVQNVPMYDLGNLNNAFVPPSQNAVSYVTGLKVGNPALYGYPNTDTARVYNDFGQTAAAQDLARLVVASKGDNTNFRPARTLYAESRDRTDVDNTTKGALTAGFFSVVPIVARSNAGVDDVNGVVVMNTSGISSAKATDGYYLANNTTISAAGDEWYSAFTVDAQCTVGIQFSKRPSSGQIARYPNNCGTYFRNAANSTDVKAIGINASDQLAIGDTNAARVDVVPPLCKPVSSIVSTATYTVATGDNNLTFSAACTVTLPSPSSFPGRELRVRTTAAGAVTSASANVVPVSGGSAGTAILSATAGKWAILVSDSAVWQTMAAN